VGEIYRSVIFFHNDEQKKIAEELKNGFAADLWPDPVVTQIEQYTRFFPADESMQNYYNRNPGAGYCMVVIEPKIQKLRQKFAEKLA
jgi:peptide-methionine (S)-S-oxide reductase